MPEVFIDTMFVMIVGRIFQQTIGIYYGYKLCSSSRRLVFLYSYEADFIQGLLKKNERKLALNNFMFGDFVDSIYPIELEIRDSIKTDRSAS